MSDDRDEQIRQRAYAIWQAEGEPHGREHEHWGRAASEIGEDISVTGAPDDGEAESAPAADAASDGSAAATTPLPGYVGAVVKTTPGTSA